MAGCSSQGPFIGGTYIDNKFVNPDIQGGTATGTELKNVSIGGNIELDERVVFQLRDYLCPILGDCLTVNNDSVAGVFNDCNGAAHVAGASIPTCQQMNAAIADAIALPVVTTTIRNTTEPNLPTTVYGNRDGVMGKGDVMLKIGPYAVAAYYIG